MISSLGWYYKQMKLTTASGKPLNPIGIGTWGIVGTWEKTTEHEAEGIEGLRYSVQKGQNHIDSGQIYGGGYTDEFIGKAIKGLERKDLFIGDKVWETNVATGKVQEAASEMLKKLGTDYIDLLYIHKPWDDFPWREAIPQIDELIDRGVVRQFGVSNFNLEQLQEAMKLSKHPVAANQLYYNLLHKQEVDDAMQAFCKEHDIQIIAYRPLEQGKVLENETVKQIAAAHSATPSQVALAWLVAKGTLTVPMAIDETFIDQNLRSLELQLTPEDMAKLDTL